MTKAEKLQEFVDESETCIHSRSLEECQAFFERLDKPELHSDAKEILTALRDEKGCVFKLDGSWRYVGGEFLSCPGGSFERAVEELIRAELLEVYVIKNHRCGMTHRAYITDAGHEAIK